jgi:hypothetical protein
MLSVLFAATFWARLHLRARRAMRTWAEVNGYRLHSASLKTMFEAYPTVSARPADVIYKVRVSTESGAIHDGQLLIWNVLFGRPEVLVHWSARSCAPGM